MKHKSDWHGEWCAGRFNSISDFAEAIQRDVVTAFAPAREHSVNPTLPDIEIRGIFIEVRNSNHGGFLKAFAEAVIRADGENFALLRHVAMALIEKYGLEKEFLDKLAKDN